MTSADDNNQPADSFEDALCRFKNNLSAELDNFFDEDAIKARRTSRPRKIQDITRQSPQLEVVNFGVVGSFLVPPGWVEGTGQMPSGQGRSRIFHQASKEGVQLCFFFRGHRVSDPAAVELAGLLARPDHFLKLSEFRAVQEIVRDLGSRDGFKLLQAATREIKGKRVLVVEGRFASREEDTYALFVDVDGSGSIVQEIYYQAPKFDFARHLFEVKVAMESIGWRLS